MSRYEVQSILVVQPSPNVPQRLRPGPNEPRFLQQIGSDGPAKSDHSWAYWESRGYLICVYISDNGRVDSAILFEFRELSLWQKLRRWLTGG
ncbi:MAG: hypothetical protein L0Y72_05785 [Gemmataceae bacterium]|nr:hypothetical protein [Gemmataceae bacterium]MCI0738535.1 hypothetical protein [Gemmataceae bacterium]